MKKIKIINDPVGGFIRISEEIFFKIIDHAFFQRLRNIRQLGMTYLVFPGATHSRFQHTLGAFQLMNEALEFLKLKGVKISKEEEIAVKLAILLHDIGHGPFSHSLEYLIVENVSHEKISRVFMDLLNKELEGKLDLAIDIFNDRYPRKFFHQLIAGQLDVDRLDYLRRDSFFSGVTEGEIGSDRIIRMMNVVDDELVIEKKGLYSIENFLIARRMMYWQVYLHKTVLGAEKLLINILRRAKYLASQGHELFASPSLRFFLYNEIELNDFNNQKVLNNFAHLDDTDILVSVKQWAENEDFVLSTLSKNLIDRKLFKVELSNEPIDIQRIEALMNKVAAFYNISKEESAYFVYTDEVKNSLYDNSKDKIKIMINSTKVADIADNSLGAALSISPNTVRRYFICYPKSI